MNVFREKKKTGKLKKQTTSCCLILQYYTCTAYLGVSTLLTLDVLCWWKKKKQFFFSFFDRKLKTQLSKMGVKVQGGSDSRFCSGQKFLLGLRDLFFSLFLESMSADPSESSSGLFWHTGFLTSDLWPLPLRAGSFGLRRVDQIRTVRYFVPRLSGQDRTSCEWRCQWLTLVWRRAGRSSEGGGGCSPSLLHLFLWRFPPVKTQRKVQRIQMRLSY